MRSARPVRPGGISQAPEPELLPGRTARRASLTAALVAGRLLAIVLIPQFSAWTH
jgi:hypothetical protein